MYMENGKPIIPNPGRKNPGISRLEFEQLKQDIATLYDQIDALKNPVNDDLELLKLEATELGIDVKGNWGANRIKKAIEDAKASKV